MTETEIPQDIPPDIWEAASEPAEVVFDASVDLYETGMESANVRLVIARALLSERQAATARERERCAGIADRFAAAGSRLFDSDREDERAQLHLAQSYGAKSVAHAIRTETGND
jgi:hypothetical protein